MSEVALTVLGDLVDLVAQRAVELVLETLGERTGFETWPACMSIDTAARYVDMPVERLRKLGARRAVPFIQEAPGCRVFFLKADLDAWMASMRHARGAA